MAGSDKRKRQRVVSVRMTDGEHTRLDQAAETAGLSLGAYLRDTGLGTPGPRTARRPPIERKELARLLGQIGKLGGNVNQIAYQLNAGGDPGKLDADIRQALLDISDMREAVLVALGREP